MIDSSDVTLLLFELTTQWPWAGPTRSRASATYADGLNPASDSSYHTGGTSSCLALQAALVPSMLLGACLTTTLLAKSVLRLSEGVLKLLILTILRLETEIWPSLQGPGKGEPVCNHDGQRGER